MDMKKKNKTPVLSGGKVIVEQKRKIDQMVQRGFGERRDRHLVLDLKEALHLMDKKAIAVYDEKGKKISRRELFEYASARERNFYDKLAVYKDLRTRGFVTKTGFKFGFDFRVYPRGKKPGEEHSRWAVHVSSQDDKFSMAGFSRMVRLAGNLKTILLVAVVDSEGDINYYEISRVTP